jgi:hypothetical protein
LVSTNSPGRTFRPKAASAIALAMLLGPKFMDVGRRTLVVLLPKYLTSKHQTKNVRPSRSFTATSVMMAS